MPAPLRPVRFSYFICILSVYKHRKKACIAFLQTDSTELGVNAGTCYLITYLSTPISTTSYPFNIGYKINANSLSTYVNVNGDILNCPIGQSANSNHLGCSISPNMVPVSGFKRHRNRNLRYRTLDERGELILPNLCPKGETACPLQNRNDLPYVFFLIKVLLFHN